MNNMEKPVGLMALVLALSIYLGITWLAMLICIGAFFILVSTIEWRKPQPAAQTAPTEEVLSPIIVQDVGEAPYLYPPNFSLKLKPDWGGNTFFENASLGLALAIRALHNIWIKQPMRKSSKVKLRTG